MSIPPELAPLLASLAEIAMRNTAGAISTRVKAVRTSKHHEEVVNELVDIINDLVTDRSELIGIARGLEDTLVAQQITDADIEYITEKIIPTIEQFLESMSDPDESEDESNWSEQIEMLKALLSVETLTILQLVGFNFKAAIGEPLTRLVQRMILSATPDADVSSELKLLMARREAVYLEIVKDPDAFHRLSLGQ